MDLIQVIRKSAPSLLCVSESGRKGVLGFLAAFMVEALTKGFLVFIIVLRHEGWVISAVSAISIVSWVPLAVSFVCLVGPATSISAAMK